MNSLKENVISYLNMGLNPAVVSFQDDGLYYLFDKLLQGKTTSNSYDPTYSFVHITLNYLDELSSTGIEKEIHSQLVHDDYEGDTIIQTYKNDIVTVCVVDDVAFLDNVDVAIKSIDALITKYRGALQFVYVIEDPMLLENFKGVISPSSHVFDALMYQQVGKHWDKKSLEDLCFNQFKVKLDKKLVDEISSLSNNHMGTFKRLYKDHALNTFSTNRYLDLLIDSFDKSLLNTFKKILNSASLTNEENKISDAYKNIGFFNNNQISIPVLNNLVSKAVVPNKLELDDAGQLKGLDLNFFNNTEKNILEALIASESEVSKSNLGDIIWKEKVNEKYSEWAIDQRIARLRKKIIDLGFNIDIQTHYGKGYKLAFINK